jgi:hypothetical protein
MQQIPYEQLDKHFTLPANFSPYYKGVRMPRKFKRKHKKIVDKFKFLPIHEKLWYIQATVNPNHTRYIIKKVVQNENK